MKQELANSIAAAAKELYGTESVVELTRPEAQFGDFATNAALQLGKQLGKNPRQIAEELAQHLRGTLSDQVREISIAGPGFINLVLDDRVLLQSQAVPPGRPLTGQSIVAEYSDPNPFKVLHAGHLYTSLVGDAIARLMQSAGASVHRVNFGGDVGLHVGKTLWAILKDLGGENPDKLADIADDQKLDWMSRHYVTGNAAYDEDNQAKSEIDELNKRVYRIHDQNDQTSPLARIYWTCRQWSYDGFESLYERLGMVPFEKYYPESLVADAGLQAVRQHTGKVYEESEGAVVFRGEDHGLFTQVFINSQGIPTYAAKDVGLIYFKDREFAPDKSFIITDAAQKDHLAVVMKSIEQFEPRLVQATTHHTHGQIKLAGGVKMSSRLGNILRADDILDAATQAAQKLSQNQDPAVVLGAVKYAFLKTRIGGDIIYNPDESVSLEGNSGPYLQYAHARARSILRKAGSEGSDHIDDLEADERILIRKISEYAETVDRAVAELMPHHICTYLYELAQTFNRFYEHNRVIGDKRQEIRLAMVRQYAETLQSGLELLGINAPDKM